MSYRPIADVWILARPKVKYYGAYPNGFLERARALLGVTPFDPVLHVCAGMVRDYPAQPRGFGPNDCTIDLEPGHATPENEQAGHLWWDARGELPAPVDFGKSVHDWPALLADPPYTEADAAKYAAGAAALPKPGELLCRMLEAVRVGGRVGLLHYVVPQPPKAYDVRFVACVAVVMGYNNRVRVFSVFERGAAA